jgi:hypothetical protein
MVATTQTYHISVTCHPLGSFFLLHLLEKGAAVSCASRPLLFFAVIFLVTGNLIISLPTIQFRNRSVVVYVCWDASLVDQFKEKLS